MSGIRRRDFLGGTVAVGVGALALGGRSLIAEEPKGKSMVVKATRDNATTNKKIDAAVVKEMVNAVVCKLAGKAKCIMTAAQMGLGVADMAKIDLVTV